MVDLHCHVLPGIDDGPKTLDESVAMARVAAEDGVESIVATPHVSHEYPTDPGEIDDRVAELNGTLSERGVALQIVRGAEVSLPVLAELDAAQLEKVTLGSGRHLLVEPPHGFVSSALERLVQDLQSGGFKPVLAHVERCGDLATKPGRLEELAERGVLCSVTAGSLAGTFGSRVREISRDLLRRNVVHNVASDAHGTGTRDPRLSPVRGEVERQSPMTEPWAWLTQAVPAAVAAGTQLPDIPAVDTEARASGSAWRRVVRLVRPS